LAFCVAKLATLGHERLGSLGILGFPGLAHLLRKALNFGPEALLNLKEFSMFDVKGHQICHLSRVNPSGNQTGGNFVGFSSKAM
jgi:hypothetical protein